MVYCYNYHRACYGFIFDMIITVGPISTTVAQMVASEDPGFTSSIPAWSHTLVDIDHEIIITVILPLF